MKHYIITKLTDYEPTYLIFHKIMKIFDELKNDHLLYDMDHGLKYLDLVSDDANVVLTSERVATLKCLQSISKSDEFYTVHLNGINTLGCKYSFLPDKYTIRFDSGSSTMYLPFTKNRNGDNYWSKLPISCQFGLTIISKVDVDGYFYNWKNGMLKVEEVSHA